MNRISHQSSQRPVQLGEENASPLSQNQVGQLGELSVRETTSEVIDRKERTFVDGLMETLGNPIKTLVETPDRLNRLKETASSTFEKIERSIRGWVFYKEFQEVARLRTGHLAREREFNLRGQQQLFAEITRALEHVLETKNPQDYDQALLLIERADRLLSTPLAEEDYRSDGTPPYPGAFQVSAVNARIGDHDFSPPHRGESLSQAYPYISPSLDKDPSDPQKRYNNLVTLKTLYSSLLQKVPERGEVHEKLLSLVHRLDDYLLQPPITASMYHGIIRAKNEFRSWVSSQPEGSQYLPNEEECDHDEVLTAFIPGEDPLIITEENKQPPDRIIGLTACTPHNPHGYPLVQATEGLSLRNIPAAEVVVIKK